MSNRIPVGERPTLEVMKGLPISYKIMLLTAIGRANKDGIYIFHGQRDTLQPLITSGLLVLNPVYHGKGISLLVLPNAPYLRYELSYYRPKKPDK